MEEWDAIRRRAGDEIHGNRFKKGRKVHTCARDLVSAHVLDACDATEDVFEKLRARPLVRCNQIAETHQKETVSIERP